MYWTDERVLEFAKVCTLGQYGDYENCRTMEQKLDRFKELTKSVKEIKLEIIKQRNDIGEDRWRVYANGMYLDMFFSFKDAENFLIRYKSGLQVDKTPELVLTETVKIKTND